MTSYTYDANGNQLTQTTTLTTPPACRPWSPRPTYDASGHVPTQTDAEGNVTTTEYDAAGNQTATIDALGNRTTFMYDDRGQLIETILPTARRRRPIRRRRPRDRPIDRAGPRTRTSLTTPSAAQIETTNPDGTTT